MKKCKILQKLFSFELYSKKLYKIMRLLPLILVITGLNVFAESSYSQNTRVNLNMQDATIKSVILAIEKQSEFFFLYSTGVVDVTKRIDVHINNERIDQVLNQMLAGTDIDFIVQDRQILLVNKDSDLYKIKQQQQITGVITDGTTREPLAGVTIQIQGTMIGAISQVNGSYSVNLPEGSNTLIFSFVGYETQEILVGGRSVIDVVMVEAVTALDEIVVIGYGTQRRKDVTGSVASVSSEAIAERPVARLDQALQGVIPGLDVVSTAATPGAGTSILLRGRRSFEASNDPLMIVDGMPFYGDLNDISPSDVSSVDVLKDASATAIYGSRGANGVIIITTKRGQISKPTFSWDSYAGPEIIYGRIPLAGAQEYAQWTREAYRTMGGYPDQPTPDPTWDAIIFDPIELATIQSGGDGPDYLKELLENGFQQKHQLSVTGGSEAVKYNFSGNYFKQEGIVPGDIFERITLSTNLDVTISSRLTSGISFQVGRTEDRRITAREAGWGGAYQRSVNATPLGRLKTPEGEDEYQLMSDALEYNPLTDYIWDCYRYSDKNWSALLNAYGEVKILPSLTYRITLGTTLRFNKISEAAGYLSLSRHKGAPTANYDEGTDTYLIYESILTFNKTFADAHQLTITAVHGIQTSSDETASVRVMDLPFEPSLWHNIGTANIINSVGSGLEEWALLSYVGRLNYGYKSKYLLSLSLRADGASQFAPDHKWGYFPSASVAWRIIEEGFMQNATSWLSDLKLRISYGVTGNQAIRPYQVQGALSRTKYGFGESNGFGYRPITLANKELKWESTAVTNIGLDFGFIRGRISGSIDVYNTDTYDLLMYRKLPIHTGFDQVLENVGKTNNKGLEVALRTVNIDRGNFLWSSNFSFFTNRTRIVELYQGKVDDVGNQWFIDHPLNVYYDYEKIGIWQLGEETEAASYGVKPGYIKIKDQNSDGQHNDADRVILGDPEPDFIANVSNNFSYQNWDFGFTTYIRWGGMTSVDQFAPYAKKRYNKIIFDYWTPENPTNAYSRPNQLYEGSGLYGSTLTYRDASYIQITQMNLGYTIPQSLVNKIKVTRARVYLQAQNPFYWTKCELSEFNMKADFAGTTVPTWNATRTIVLGVNLNF